MKELLKNDINKDNLEDQNYLEKYTFQDQDTKQKDSNPICTKISASNSSNLLNTFGNVLQSNLPYSKPSNINLKLLDLNKMLIASQYPKNCEKNQDDEAIEPRLEKEISVLGQTEDNKMISNPNCFFNFNIQFNQCNYRRFNSGIKLRKFQKDLINQNLIFMRKSKTFKNINHLPSKTKLGENFENKAESFYHSKFWNDLLKVKKPLVSFRDPISLRDPFRVGKI